MTQLYSAVLVQFRIAKASLLPGGFPQKRQPSIDELNARLQSHPTGNLLQAITSDWTVDAFELRTALEDAGYVLAYGTAEHRKGSMRYEKDHYVVKFHFVPRGTEVTTDTDMLALLSETFSNLSSNSFWKLQGYQNPATQAGALPWLSLNFASREQRYHGDDVTKTRLVRARDAEGKPTGEPMPLVAEAKLTFSGGQPVVTALSI